MGGGSQKISKIKFWDYSPCSNINQILHEMTEYNLLPMRNSIYFLKK